MRASATRLLHSSIRLSDVAYPASSILLARTRLAYLHIDNLISFAKRPSTAMSPTPMTVDRKSTRLNSSHTMTSRMPSSA